MFYRCFLESVERWPSAPAVEIQRQPAVSRAPSPLSSLSTTEDGHTVESFTYQQLRKVSDAVAGWLAGSGFAGARCAILGANSPAWVAVYLGTIGSGNVAVPLDTAFHAEQVRKLLDGSGCSILFADHRSMALAQEATSGSEIQLVALDSPEEGQSLAGMPCVREIALAAKGEFTPADTQPDDVAAIIYTSGTTSDPKGVMLTDGNLTAELMSIRQFVPLGPGDGLLGVLPLFHVLAQMANLFLPLGNGGKVVFLDSLNTQELTLALRERGITVFCCVPQFFYLIHERIFGEVARRGRLEKTAFRMLCSLSMAAQRFGVNLGKLFFRRVHAQLGPNIRYFVTGGSRFDAQIGRDIQALGFPMLQAYGLTETTSGCFCTPPDDNVIGSIGRPLPGIQAKLIDPAPDESGRLVGEIAVSGPTIMKGYYNRPDATAEVLRDGWLYTGDLAYCDAGGHYFISGRAKDVIVLSSGKNIYPEEIESHYLRSQWIKELCVLGVESRKPGEPLSERLHAVIVPNFEVLRENRIANVREVLRFDIEGISASLPPTKRILSYDIWQQDLPRTTTRKIRRREVERLVREHQASDVAGDSAVAARPLTEEEGTWLRSDEVSPAIETIAAAAGKKPSEIHPADNLELDLGLDSMQRVELLTALAQRFNAAVEDSAASQLYTVRETVELVLASRGGQMAHARGWGAIFAEEMTDPEVLAIANGSRVLDMLRWILATIVRSASRLLCSLRIDGLENLPEPPYILCPNHVSYLDPPVLTAALPWRELRTVFFVGTSEIFGAGLMRHFARLLHLIPLDPDSNLVPAMRAGAFGLRSGRILMLYPEGERSIDGTPRVFKKGAAILAQHLNVPLVPVAQHGFYECWPRGKNFQGFHPMRIRVGKPIYPDAAENPDQAVERLTKELRDRVVELWNELESLSEK
jgi:long-chain acyl-CoA synthetase